MNVCYVDRVESEGGSESAKSNEGTKKEGRETS